VKIVFLGTPEFAGICLESIINHGMEVAVVVTAPDKKKGRGQQIMSSDVKAKALKYEIPVLQPKNLKDPVFLKELKAFKADLGVVVAFRMLPAEVWDMPKLGTINLHASLLPNYRGAAPINWAIIHGEPKTGITTFFLKQKMDTGDIILQKEVEIEESMNAGELHDLLALRGSELLIETIKTVQEKTYQLQKQQSLISSEEELKEAPKIFKEDCKIDWSGRVENIYNFIRGLSPYPGAWTDLVDDKGKLYTLKIYKAEKTDIESKKPSDIVTDNKKELLIGTKDSYIRILNIQLQGKQRMDIESFLRGFKFERVSIKS